MPNISMNKDAHKFAPVMLDVPGDCVAGSAAALHGKVIGAAGYPYRSAWTGSGTFMR